MGENKRYYWLQTPADLFTSKRIKKLRKLGADFFVIYLKLQLLSLNSRGVLEFSGIEKSFSEELALDIDEDPDKIQLTLAYLQSCGLLETREDEIFLPYVEICTGSETASTRRSQKSRAKSKIALQCNTDATLLQQNATDLQRRDRDIYRDRYRDTVRPNKDENESQEAPVNYQEIIDAYNSICTDLPRVQKVSEKRKKKIKQRLLYFTKEEILEAFKLTQESDFLCGRAEKEWKASFDWLFENNSNMLKVIEGNYTTFGKNKKSGITINPEQREGYTDDIFGEFE